MKCFPLLSQRTVDIQTGEERISVPMLPVGELDKVFDIGTRLEHIESKESVEEARAELIALAKQSLPAKFHEGLMRLRLVQLVELVSYLAFGDESSADDGGGEGKPKKREEDSTTSS